MTALAKKQYANDGSLESVEALLRKLAGKCFKRVQAMGLGMDFDDVLQEMRLTWVKANASWSPDRGVKFTTYCQTACMNNFNQRIERPEKDRAILGLVNFTDMAGGDDSVDADEVDILEIMDGDGSEDSPEDFLVHREEMKSKIDSLSPNARRLITSLLISERTIDQAPPPRLRELAQGVGLSGRELRQVKLEILGKFGVTWF